MERPTCQPTIHSVPINLVLTGVEFTISSNKSPEAGHRCMNLQLGCNKPNAAQYLPRFTRTSIWGGPSDLPTGVVPPRHPLLPCRVGDPLIHSNEALQPRGPKLYVVVYLLRDDFRVRFIFSFLWLAASLRAS